MKRRLLRVSGGSYTSTLPIDWVKKHNLTSGSDIHFSEHDGNLVVSAATQMAVQKKVLDARKVNGVIERLIPALYRVGNDEVEVLYENPDTMKHIQDVLDRELIGYGIVDQGTKTCLIKDVSGADTQVVDTVLRRCFRLLIANAEKCAEGMKVGDKDMLREVVRSDKNINKFTNLCERLLMKKKHTNTAHAMILFHIIKELENIADEYKYLARYCAEKKCDKKAAGLLTEVNALLNRAYTIFYDFDIEEAEKVSVAADGLKKKLHSYTGDALLGHHMLSIARRLRTMLSGWFSLKL